MRRNARFPVWNQTRIVTPRATGMLKLGDVIVLRVYDWDDLMADDLVGTGLIKVDQELLAGRGPCTVKLELTPDAAMSAYLMALPDAAVRATKKAPGFFSRLLQRAANLNFGRQDPKALAKKNLVQVPPTELTVSFSQQSTNAKKRIFFVVHSDSEVDEAERMAQDGKDLQALLAKLQYDHGLSIKGIAEADHLRTVIGAWEASSAKAKAAAAEAAGVGDHASSLAAAAASEPASSISPPLSPLQVDTSGDFDEEEDRDKVPGIDQESDRNSDHDQLREDLLRATAVFSSPQVSDL